MRVGLVCAVLGILLMPARALGTEAERALDACIAATSDGDWELAIEQCSDAIRANASSPTDMATALLNRCAGYSMRGDEDRAKHDCEAAISLDPNEAGAHNNLGRLYHQDGDEDQAIWHYDAAIRIAPDDPAAYNNRGVSYDKKGDIDRALADYNAAILRDPGYADAFVNRGELYHNSGEFRRALVDFSESLRLRPNNIKTLRYRAITYRDLGEFDSAVADLDQALRLLPDDARLLGERGKTHFAERKFAAAARDLDRALAADADPHRVYLVFWYGIARARAGADLAAALAPHAARFEKLDWPRPIFRRLLGEVDDQAVLAQIPQDDPSETGDRRCVASFYLGELYLLRNDEERAAAFFRSADETGILDVTECTVARLELSRLKS